MPCPTGRFGPELFQEAMQSLNLWEAMFCSYGAPLGELIVGTVLYSAVAINIFARTGSLIIPFILALILGGTILAQMYAVISAFVGIIVLIVAPMVVSAIIFMIDRRG